MLDFFFSTDIGRKATARPLTCTTKAVLSGKHVMFLGVILGHRHVLTPLSLTDVFSSDIVTICENLLFF